MTGEEAISSEEHTREGHLKPIYRNIFLAVGIVAVLLMVRNLDVTWDEVAVAARRAGIWLPACLLLWLVIYLMNAWAWSLIIKAGRPEGDERGVGFWRVLKYTITGYALNYVTPAGVLGGEPYRILELKSFLGTERAVSCVLLNSMMHIFSHFCFWAFSILLFLATYFSRLNWASALLLALASAFVAAGIYVFVCAYRYGMAEKSVAWLTRVPWVGGRVEHWMLVHRDMLHSIDEQITALRLHSPRTFYTTLFLEFLARLVGCLELQFILFVFTNEVLLADCIMMQGFTSLIANVVFFIPMQVGVREASMALFANFTILNGGYGVLTSLIVRIREIVWITIGMCLLKAGNPQAVPVNQSKVEVS